MSDKQNGNERVALPVSVPFLPHTSSQLLLSPCWLWKLGWVRFRAQSAAAYNDQRHFHVLGANSNFQADQLLDGADGAAILTTLRSARVCAGCEWPESCQAGVAHAFGVRSIACRTEALASGGPAPYASDEIVQWAYLGRVEG